MSPQDEQNPDAQQTASATGPAPPPLFDAPRHDLVPGSMLLPELTEGLGSGRASRPAILYAAPRPVDLIKALQRRWLLATALAVVLAVPAAIVAYFNVPVTFMAESWLRMKSTTLVYSDVRTQSSGAATHAMLIRSYFVLNAALSQPGISELPWIREAEARGEDPTDWLKGRIQISVPGRGRAIMKLSMAGDDPVQLQQLVKAVTDAYLDRVVDSEKRDALKHQDNLEKVYYEKAREVDLQRQQIRDLAVQVGSSDSEEAAAQQKLLTEYLLNLRKETVKFRHQKVAANFQLRNFEEQVNWAREKNRPPNELVRQQIAEDEALLELAGEIEAKKQDENRLDGIVPPTSPRLRKLQQQVAGLEKQQRKRMAELLAELKEKIRRGEIRTKVQQRHFELVQKLANLKRTHEALRDEYISLASDVKKLRAVSVDLDRQKEQLKSLLRVTNELGFELEKLQLELSAGLDRVQLIQEARLPKTRDTKRRDKTTMMAAFGGVALALAATALLEFHFRRITSGEEMADGLGINVLGNVPLLTERRWRFRRGGAINSAEDLQGMMDESVDGIRAMLLHSAAGESIRTLLVTSAKAGEGKTTVSAALAASLGRSGRRTLLVDGDLRRPSVHRLLDMPLDEGFAEVLRGEASIEEVIRPSRAAGLWFMSAGQCDHVCLQALTKEGLGDIFEKLRAEFDFVIVDSGPAMAVVDPLLVGQHCDGAIISVVRRVSQIPAVYETCERLRSTGIRIVGCVVNGLQGNPFTPGYYAYAYAYGYGNGHANGASAEAAEPSSGEPQE